MNGFKVFLAVFVLGIVAFSCKKDDDGGGSVAPPRDRVTQYSDDLRDIDNFLDTHYMEVDVAYNVTFAKLPEDGTKTSIRAQQEYPLQFEMVKNDSRIRNNTLDLAGRRIDDPVDYKVYYLVFNEGGGTRPVKVDSIFMAYRGILLNNKQFGYAPNPVGKNLDVHVVKDSKGNRVVENTGDISGMRNMIPLFRTCESFTENPDGTVVYNNHGAGVIFLPSGLGYFNIGSKTIPSYSPLIFAIKLMQLKNTDQDRDGILSIYEDINHNGDFYDDDTDNDGIPDFLDTDDDGDGHSTRKEITDKDGKLYKYEDIPHCPGGSKKKHLDPSCH